MSVNSKRRGFLKMGTGVAGAALFFGGARQALGSVCKLTPMQTAGPFYPGEKNFDTNVDLTQLPGHNLRAKGQVVYVTGKVLDAGCQPVENANVEIWQACASGKYNNPRDPSTQPLDPHFKYWAETFTNAKGEYSFKTIIPGSYAADVDWIRPPHIHFKISRLGYHDLITQMYFKGEKYNATDLILQNVAASERDSVIVDFKPSPMDLEPGSLIDRKSVV